ncbi:MAG: DUF1080 domain-containing protein [Acidobacteria bacterium]|nr:DUF1080 domain-containing protein [Acidobacteriota bacterium]
MPRSISLALTLLLSIPAAAADPAPNRLTAQEKTDGWLLLFDGRTLNGWHDPRKKSPPGDGWTIEDGAIRVLPNPRIREDLITTRKFRDFELTFDWRLEKGSNTGLKYRVQGSFFLDRGKYKPGAKSFEEIVGYELANRLSDRSHPSEKGGEEYVIAMEYQLIDNATHRDARRGPLYQTGAIYSMVPASRDATKPVGEWNTSRVILRGDKVEHYLNGEKVNEAMLNSSAIRDAVAKRWQKDAPTLYEQLAGMPQKACPIALQHHNDAAWFRNIKIRELKPAVR